MDFPVKREAVKQEVLDVPPSSYNPRRRAAVDQQQRTQRILASGAIDSQVTDSQYVNALVYAGSPSNSDNSGDSQSQPLEIPSSPGFESQKDIERLEDKLHEAKQEVSELENRLREAGPSTAPQEPPNPVHARTLQLSAHEEHVIRLWRRQREADEKAWMNRVTELEQNLQRIESDREILYLRVMELEMACENHGVTV
ncbi:hypothetical protein CC2G_003129 [Coprinopsis cinerea AmutBmut pab1-1]|nr:hypothetical protein CC2G_003129 [Coprinopsis cinerea AmutBmut pab1-1]